MSTSSTSLSISMQYWWHSISDTNPSVGNRGCLTQIFRSVVLIKMIGILLALGVEQQLFTTRPFCKLWCTTCSTIYDCLLLSFEIAPGTVNVALPVTNCLLIHTNFHCAHKPIFKIRIFYTLHHHCLLYLWLWCIPDLLFHFH